MTDFSNSVIMPREDFIELSTVAFDNSHVPTAGERTASVIQTTAVFAGLAAAIAGASWGWATAVEWRERKQHERVHGKPKITIDNTK